MSLYKKKISVGQFLKRGEDYKNGDSLEIANEGKQVEGQFGLQDVFLMKLANGMEGNVSINQTSLNNLIDGYGEDSKNWIGKKVKVMVITIPGQGSRYYFLHPDAEVNEDGDFVLKSNQSAPQKDGEVNVDNIPF